MLYKDVTLNDEQIFSNRLECDKNTLRWVETDLSTGPGPANCCPFEKQTFQYFHTNLTTGQTPSLSWYLNCLLLAPKQQNGPESCSGLVPEIGDHLKIGLWRASVGVTLGPVMEILTCSQPGSRSCFTGFQPPTLDIRFVSTVSYCLQICQHL